ncbi:VOC family protein [Cellulomonas sp. HZM]|uniref:VOC family protein n=1 Tax=Cellulomonas sp. HZM TaxID=1454010 RepID=UPI00068FD879|nr:VOC family protein [Cellulomonas sp. HZM]
MSDELPAGATTHVDGVGYSLSATVLESRDANAHADFYRRLLGWTTIDEEPGWVILRPPGGGSGLSFSTDELYEPPVWPAQPGAQQMQDHLDIHVDDLSAAVERALACGATLAEYQPQDDVRVLVDPAGHLFCHFES